MSKRKERIKEILINAKNQHGDDNHLVIVPEIMSKQFVAYSAMRYNLELIEKFSAELRKKIDDPILSASLTYSIISLYGKCFTDATKKKYPKLEPNEIFECYDELRKSHDYLMELRHTFISHRGDNDDEVGISYLSINKANSKKIKIRYRQLKLSAFSKEKLDKFDKLFSFVLTAIHKKINKSGQKMASGMMNKFSAKELSHMGFNNIE